MQLFDGKWVDSAPAAEEIGADGRFRRIVVQVTDHPDMRIRTRSGYTPNRRSPVGALE